MPKQHVDDPEIDEHEYPIEADNAEPDDEGEGDDGDGEELDEQGEPEALEGEFVVSFGDDDPEDIPDDDPHLIKKLRDTARDALGDAASLRKRLAELEKPTTIELGPKPTLESCDWIDEKYEAELDAWKDRERAHKDQQAKANAEREAADKRGREIFGRYEEQARRMPVRDFDAAQQLVVDKLGQNRFGYIVAGAKDPAKLVYALAQHPGRLDALAKEEIDARFTFAAAALEKDMKVATRKPPAPETVERGSAPMSRGVDKVEQRLEEKAARTGDRSELIRYRAEKKERARA